jgi:hypothetical protein
MLSQNKTLALYSIYIFWQIMPSSGVTIDCGLESTLAPDDGILCRNIYILSSTPAFYFLVLPSVSPVVIVIMYHPVLTPESFEMDLCYS